jgi:hypothetical protein
LGETKGFPNDFHDNLDDICAHFLLSDIYVRYYFSQHVGCSLHTAAGWWLPIACLYILYLGTYLSNMYILVRCNITDPGVMPGIKSDKIDPKKKYCNILLRHSL